MQFEPAAGLGRVEQADQLVLRKRARQGRRRTGEVVGKLHEQLAPFAARIADDLVVRALAANVVMLRDGGEHRNADRFGECMGFAGAVVLVDEHACDADIAAELAEVLHRRADIVGDVQRLQVVGADHDDLLAHVAGDRQAEAAADHVAQEVEQHEVEIPLVEAELLEQLEAVDDAASAAAAPDFRTAEFHREDAVALEADIADLHFLAGFLLLRGSLDDGRAGLAAEQEGGGVALGVAADQQDLSARLRQHVGEVGEREALADAALAVDRNDLRFLLHLGNRQRLRLVARFLAKGLGILFVGLRRAFAHSGFLQSSTILRHDGSSNACS